MTAYVDQVGTGESAHYVVSCFSCRLFDHMEPGDSRSAAELWADEHNAKHEEAWIAAKEEGLL